jgi:hypothetical protein
MSNNTKMVELLALLCVDFEEKLRKKEMTTADRKALIDFLKNNDITAENSIGSPLGQLVKNLPFDDDTSMLVMH